MIRRLALLLLLAAPPLAQEPGALDAAARAITADRLKAHLAVLAADDYEGRNAGYPGNDKASEYIAAHFAKIGLRPAGEKDGKGAPTWFQPFTVAKRPTRNVLALAEGSDPALKSEFVILGAHFDHVGMEGQTSFGRLPGPRADKDDKIWNGADDNGSGTVTVLEIARAFMEGKLKTKRSILFIAFSGEEWGLIGSRHYVDHPLFPLAKTVAMINLDMVGRNGTKPMEVAAVSTADEWAGLCEEAAKGTGLEYATSPEVSQGSDHWSFSRKRIPAVHFFTGFHADYHRQSDHAEKIDYDRMAKVGRFGLRLLALVADRPERMEFTGTAPRLLGIDAQELDEAGAKALALGEGEGGVRILSVEEGSAAAAAGLKAGDALVEFDGRKLPLEEPLKALAKALKAAKDNVDVPLAALRDGKRIELKAVWAKKRQF